MNRELTVNRARIERDAYPYLRSTLNCTRNRYTMDVSRISPNQGHFVHCPVMPTQLSGPISWKDGMRRLKDYFWHLAIKYILGSQNILGDSP